MRKTFEFVKVGGVWFYWWPDFDGDPGELAMVGGADDLLDSLDDRFVRLQMVDPSVAKIVLSKIEEDENGATYLCKSKNYNDRVWICPVTLLVFNEYPQNIYLSEFIMKTLDEIVNNYEEWSVFLDDRFGVRLAQFLTQEQLEKIGFKWNSDEPYPEPKEWTRENILSQLKEDVEFGFEKALDKRGISASLMFAVVLRWNRVLEEGLEDYPEDNYAMYLPLFKATAEKYGWENPIGDDSGSEDYYNEEYDEGLYCD